jgi:hypothetical protein
MGRTAGVYRAAPEKNSGPRGRGHVLRCFVSADPSVPYLTFGARPERVNYLI